MVRVIIAGRSTAGTATVTFGSPAAAAALECAVVRQGVRGARPVYARCGRTKAFGHLRPGRYVIYVRSLGSDGLTSSPVERRFTVASRRGG
jgi:hypothetical protein